MVNISIVARDNTREEKEISDLLKLATAQAGDKDYDSAIQSLKRAYSLMATVSTEWPISAYFRLARYLHLSGKYLDALDWLQQLHDNLDFTCDAREQLYKKQGLMQSGNKPARISKTIRNNLRREVNDEISLYKERQHKIEQRLEKQKEKAAGRATPKLTAKNATSVKRSAPQPEVNPLGADVGGLLYHFSQYCFVGEKSEEPLDLSAEDYIFARLTNGPLTALDVHQLPSKHRGLLREILTQYIMFLERNPGLSFPAGFLDGSSKETLAPTLLQYMHKHRWPFPQMLPPRR